MIADPGLAVHTALFSSHFSLHTQNMKLLSPNSSLSREQVIDVFLESTSQNSRQEKKNFTKCLHHSSIFLFTWPLVPALVVTLTYIKRVFTNQHQPRCFTCVHKSHSRQLAKYIQSCKSKYKPMEMDAF